MKENLGDIVMNLAIERRNKVSDYISQRYKGTKPFASVRIPTEKAIWARDNLGIDDIVEIEKEFGRDAFNQKLYEIHQLGGEE